VLKITLLYKNAWQPRTGLGVGVAQRRLKLLSRFLVYLKDGAKPDSSTVEVKQPDLEHSLTRDAQYIGKHIGIGGY
jgi:hypothetical protein